MKNLPLPIRAISFASVVPFSSSCIPMTEIVMPLLYILDMAVMVSSSGFVPVVGKASVKISTCLVVVSGGSSSSVFSTTPRKSVCSDAVILVIECSKVLKSCVGATKSFIRDANEMMPTLSCAASAR